MHCPYTYTCELYLLQTFYASNSQQERASTLCFRESKVTPSCSANCTYLIILMFPLFISIYIRVSRNIAKMFSLVE